MVINALRRFWHVDRESIHLKEMEEEEERHFFSCEKGKRKCLDFPGHAQLILFSVSDKREMAAHGPAALEKPLTGCVSRTQPLVCFAEE